MIEITKEDGHTMYYYTVGEVAKMLQLVDDNNKSIGRNRFFRCLRYNGVILQDNTPSQYFIMLDLALLHTTTKRWKNYGVPVFTEKGINYLKNKFGDGDYVVYVDREEDDREGLSIDDVC